ncbi:hypothetical protein SynBIOSE41_04338 [Synechococcus sp. BIOS-E4-1]|nr:hypothetical protein SynBIOSE41_04338 [Synechococcus sp. BIOS-E4-1]
MGDVSSACFSDGGIITEMIFTSDDKQMKVIPLIASEASLRAAED